MEIELKLLVAPEDLAVLPRHPALQTLQRTEPRIEQLRTLYYDTAARDLAQAGIALRVRRSGTQWIQTLKAGGRSAGGLHERVELEWPLADAALDPTRLADTPYADLFADERVRDGLAPVFETEFERTAILLGFADGTTAELALDRGVVRAGARSEPISEIEIELLSGSAQPLFDLALTLSENISLRLGYLSKAERGDALATGRVGLPRKASPVVLDPAWTALQGLRHIILGCVAHMQANEQGVLDADDAEYLHQLRVGLRRLRSCIGLFRFVAPKRSYAGLVDELRWLSGELGPARDWDVYVEETLPALRKAVPAIDALQSAVQSLRAQYGERARQAVSSSRYARLLLQLAQRCNLDDFGLVPEHGKKRIALDAPLGEFAKKVLRKRHRRLRRHGGALLEMSAEARHGVRIEAKKLRYAAEFFGSLYAVEKVAAYVDALRDLQDTLGILNDAAQTERLTEEAARAHAQSADAQIVAAVCEWETARTERELKRYDKRWRAFEKAERFWR